MNGLEFLQGMFHSLEYIYGVAWLSYILGVDLCGAFKKKKSTKSFSSSRVADATLRCPQFGWARCVLLAKIH